MKRGYIFLLLSIFLFSCGENKQEGNTTFKRIPIEYRKASSIKLSEFVDSICIVPLETNTENLIGEIGRTIFMTINTILNLQMDAKTLKSMFLIKVVNFYLK